jgi:Fe-S cluster assembly iron-binding protein IscA
MTLEESKTDDDILDEEYGVSLLTDKKLSAYLEGATVDYVESAYGEGFEIRTPRAASGGGCGGCSGC